MERINTEWISAREVGRRLNISMCAVERIVRLNGVRRQVLKGAWTRFHSGDVDVLAALAVQGEGVEPVRAVS